MTDPRVPDDWAVIAETHDGTEADLIRGRLQEEGIDAVVLDSRTAPGAWLTGSQPHWAPKTIAVPASEADRAVDILEEGPGGLPPVAPVGGLEESEPDAIVGIVSEPFDGRPTMLGRLVSAAWVIAGLIIVSLLFLQCPGSV